VFKEYICRENSNSVHYELQHLTKNQEARKFLRETQLRCEKC